MAFLSPSPFEPTRSLSQRLSMNPKLSMSSWDPSLPSPTLSPVASIAVREGVARPFKRQGDHMDTIFHHFSYLFELLVELGVVLLKDLAESFD
jgi:hypothetical protein